MDLVEDDLEEVLADDRLVEEEDDSRDEEEVLDEAERGIKYCFKF